MRGVHGRPRCQDCRSDNALQLSSGETGSAGPECSQCFRKAAQAVYDHTVYPEAMFLEPAYTLWNPAIVLTELRIFQQVVPVSVYPRCTPR